MLVDVRRSVLTCVRDVCIGECANFKRLLDPVAGQAAVTNRREYAAGTLLWHDRISYAEAS